MKNILIVGGLGFLGSTILKRLSDLSSYFIYVYDFKNPSASSNENKKDIRFINANEFTLKSLLEKYRFHFIINAAVIYETDLQHQIFETNFVMPLKILDYGVINGCRNFIFFDSFL